MIQNDIFIPRNEDVNKIFIISLTTNRNTCKEEQSTELGNALTENKLLE